MLYCMYQQFWSEIGLWYNLFCFQGHSCCPMLYVIDGSGNLQFGGKLDTSTKKEAAGLRLAILKLVSWWHCLSFYEQFYFLNKCYRRDENETIYKIDLNNWSFTVNCYSFSLVLFYKLFLKILNLFLSFRHYIKILIIKYFRRSYRIYHTWKMSSKSSGCERYYFLQRNLISTICRVDNRCCWIHRNYSRISIRTW